MLIRWDISYTVKIFFYCIWAGLTLLLYVHSSERRERWHPGDRSVETVCVLSWGHHHRASSTDGETAAEAHFIHPSPARAVSFSSLLVYTFHRRYSSLLLWFLLIFRPINSLFPYSFSSIISSLSLLVGFGTPCARLISHINTQNKALRVMITEKIREQSQLAGEKSANQ
jgi:hypothetical protein